MKPSRPEWFVLLFVSALIVSTTSANGPDFHVYWNAVAAMFRGEPLYSVTRDGIMVFKYPTWIAPLFAPWALLDWDWARRAWGLLEAICFLTVSLDLRKRSSVSSWGFMGVVVAFYGLLIVHAFNGQVSLILLACAWFGLRSADSQNPSGSWNQAGSIVILSAKFFSLFPILGSLKTNHPIQTKTIYRAAYLALPLAFVPFLLSNDSPAQVVKQMLAAMGPGRDPQTQAVLIGISGLEAQGIGSAIFRLFSFPQDLSWAVWTVSLIVFGGVGGYWWIRSQRLDADLAWAGWVALTAVVQPLSGFHTYVLALPLAVLAWERAERTRSGTVWTALGILCVTALTQKTLGQTVGTWLQTISIKSIGVLILTETVARRKSLLVSVR